MWRRRSGRRTPSRLAGPRIWTAFYSVDGYIEMAATRSERDDHDEQIMAAARDVLRLMRRTGAEYGLIYLFRYTVGGGDEFVERRTVTMDERGLVVSANEKTEPYRDPTLRDPTLRDPTLRDPTLPDPTLPDPTLPAEGSGADLGG
jgi:hypothetical protein